MNRESQVCRVQSAQSPTQLLDVSFSRPFFSYLPVDRTGYSRFSVDRVSRIRVAGEEPLYLGVVLRPPRFVGTRQCGGLQLVSLKEWLARSWGRFALQSTTQE